jgi:hypothetical protein
MSTDEGYYDVALSFAGEDRPWVEQVAKILKDNHVRVFYDKDEEVYLWGEDLGDALDEIYRRRSRYVVIFSSQHYAEKLWTNHERKSALARALQEKRGYVLPARFDDTALSGLSPSISYIDLRNETPESFASKILHKIFTQEPDVTNKRTIAAAYKESQHQPPPSAHLSSLSILSRDKTSANVRTRIKLLLSIALLITAIATVIFIKIHQAREGVIYKISGWVDSIDQGAIKRTIINHETSDHKPKFPFPGQLYKLHLTVEQFTNGEYCARGEVRESPNMGFRAGETSDELGESRSTFQGGCQVENGKLAFYLNPSNQCD